MTREPSWAGKIVEAQDALIAEQAELVASLKERIAALEQRVRDGQQARQQAFQECAKMIRAHEWDREYFAKWCEQEASSL